MDLSCFGSNYIGIRGECTDVLPLSGLYINDLSGISLKLIAKIADEETAQAVQLIRQQEAQAIRGVWHDLITRLSCDVQINKVLDIRTIGKHRYDTEAIYDDPAPGEVGIVIDKVDADDLTRLCVNYVDIRANTELFAKQLKITDGCTEKIYTFDLMPCEPTRVHLNYEGTTDRITITVDSSDVSLEAGSLSNGCGCCNPCSCSSLGCFSVSGWDGTKKVGKRHGMVVNASCVCSDSALLCSLTKIIAPAVQLKLGVLLMYEVLNSKRCNYLALNSKDDAQRMLLAWQGGIDMGTGIEFKGEYGRMITQTAQRIKQALQHIESKCVACAGLKIVESIP